MEVYTFSDVLDKSLEWCIKNDGWKRICDIEDTDSLYYSWNELPSKIKSKWKNNFENAEDAWSEFGERVCKVPYGFVSDKGEFYNDILQVPRSHNFMMVFKIE